MISRIDAGSAMFLANLDRIGQSIARAERQISSGRRIASASDAPDQIATVLQLHADLARNDQIKADLDCTQAETDTATAALSTAVSVLDRATTLGLQATGTMSPDIRKSIAQELGDLLRQMVSISRTTVQGSYIFSGDPDQDAPIFLGSRYRRRHTPH